MEKRKKHHAGEDAYHVDVQEYENKKSTFRRQWIYLAVVAVVLVVIYIRYGSGTSNDPKTASAFVDPKTPRNSSYAQKQQKPSYTTKTAVVATEQVAKLASPEAAVPHEAEQLVATRANLRSEAPPAISTTVAAEGLSEAELQEQVDAQIDKVRKLKFERHLVMEKDPEAQREIKILQDLVRQLIYKQYGKGPLRVEMKLQFPQSMSQATMPQEQTLMIDLAPVTLVPYSVYFFLEIVKHWKVRSYHAVCLLCTSVPRLVVLHISDCRAASPNSSTTVICCIVTSLTIFCHDPVMQSGAFSRNAGHVLQANVNLDLPKGELLCEMCFVVLLFPNPALLLIAHIARLIWALLSCMDTDPRILLPAVKS
jgi:hypothetical protein